MSPKTGRPKLENPKTVSYHVRVDAETNEALTEYSDREGISVIEAIRKAIRQLLAKEK